MDKGPLELEIVSPEKRLFMGRVTWVQLPGAMAPFRVLRCHAPMVSTLCAGDIRWESGGEERCLAVKSGFVEVNNDRVMVLVEVKSER